MIGKQISLARQNMFLTKAALSRLVGVHPATILSWESGRTEPNSDATRKLAEALNVTTDYLHEVRHSCTTLPEHVADLAQRIANLPFRDRQVLEKLVTVLESIEQPLGPRPPYEP